MGRFVDNIIAYRILKLLTTPFTETDAYRLGIIDSKGHELKKMRDLHTDEELVAYTLLHRLVFRLKKMVEKVPIENKKLVSFAAALALIKEAVDNDHEPLDLEMKFLNILKSDLSEEIDFVTENINTNRMLKFSDYASLREEGEGAPANNVSASPGIALTQGAPLFGKKITRRKKNV